MAERISRVQIGSLAGLISFFLLLAVSLFAWGGSTPEPLKTESLEPIAGIIEQAILEGKTPGAVVLIGQGRTVAYHKAFGLKALAPEKEPMPEDAPGIGAAIPRAVAPPTKTYSST